jgi:carbon-monoxide dehydrogenase large subunit
MGVEGIGASVVRKEDRRFITGKGRTSTTSSCRA